MTIGELLKKFRVKQLKTQKEWAAGVVTPSYYSKVEKNLHRITAEDLIAILRINHVKPWEFFNQLDENQQARNVAFNEIEEEVNRAYYQNNPKKIEEIRQYVENSDIENKDKLLLLIDFNLADTLNNVAELSDTKKAQLKNWLFEQDDFDERTLRMYINFISIYDLKSNLKIGKKIAEKLKGTTETRKQEELLGVIINILIVCIEQGAYDETGYFVQAAEHIRTVPKLFFYKNMLVFLENMINEHFDHQEEYVAKCQWAIKNFDLLGMPEYGKEAERFFNEYQ